MVGEEVQGKQEDRSEQAEKKRVLTGGADE